MAATSQAVDLGNKVEVATAALMGLDLPAGAGREAAASLNRADTDRGSGRGPETDRTMPTDGGRKTRKMTERGRRLGTGGLGAGLQGRRQEEAGRRHR